MIEANILIGFEGGAEFWAVGTTRVVDDELGHVEDKNQLPKQASSCATSVTVVFNLVLRVLTVIRGIHSWNESCDVCVDAAEKPSCDDLPLSDPHTDRFWDGIASSQFNLSHNISVFINTPNYWEKCSFWVWCWPSIDHLLTRSYAHTVSDGVTMNRLHSRMCHD